MGIVSSVRNFVRTNITGGTSTKDYLPTDDPRGKEVKQDLDRLNDRVDKVDKDVDDIGEQSKLKPPSLSNFTNRELLLTGATGGAVIGGALGMLDGSYSVWADSVNPNVTSTSHDILQPTFKGAQDSLVQDLGSNGHIQGYNHTFTAQIETKNVGTYTTPDANPQHTTTGSPLQEGIKGVLGGALIGAALGGAVLVGRHLAGQAEPTTDADGRRIEGEGKVIAVTTGTGAALGAGLGLIAGLQEQSHSQPIHLTWQQPVMEHQVLGQIEQNHYHSAFTVTNESTIPKVDVTADAPKMHRNLLLQSVPDMQDQSRDVVVQPRFSLAGEVIGSAVVGGVIGAAGGVAVNVLRRVL